MSHEPFWALDTKGTWHLYSHVGVAYCGYKTNGVMVNGPRPEPPEVSPVVTAPDGTVLGEELVCDVCRRGAPQVEFRACQNCGFECECQPAEVCIGADGYGEYEYDMQALCTLCANTPQPHDTANQEMKRIICYVGNSILAELRRLGLQPRGPYR